jgi:hypothetical protein
MQVDAAEAREGECGFLEHVRAVDHRQVRVERAQRGQPRLARETVDRDQRHRARGLERAVVAALQSRAYLVERHAREPDQPVTSVKELEALAQRLRLGQRRAQHPDNGDPIDRGQRFRGVRAGGPAGQYDDTQGTREGRIGERRQHGRGIATVGRDRPHG